MRRAAGGWRELGAPDAALFSGLLAVACSAVFYRYGLDNQAAELPIVLRAMDPGYLPLDFYTNASDGPGPRRPFALLLAALATPASLPRLCLALVLAGNAALGLVSWWAAARLFPAARLAPPLAATLALSVSTFRLGYAGELYASELVSSPLAAPLVLIAIASGARAQPLAAGACAALACALHFPFGLQAGLLALLLCLPRRVPGLPRGAPLGRWTTGAALLAGAALALAPLAWPRGGLLGAEFLAIETRLRHPQHSLWSAFPLADRLRAAAFAGAVAGALWLLARAPRARDASAQRLLWLLAALALGALLCVGLLALAPHAALAAARPLRLLWIGKWIGLVWIAGALGAAASAPRRALAARVGIAALGAAALRPSAGAAFVLGVGAAAAAALLQLPRRGGRAALAASAAALLAHMLFGASLPRPLAALAPRLRPPLDLEALSGPELEVARAARERLPRDALVLVPPDFARFRLVAERAVVVDFKAFPFGADAMREWRARLFGCYGEPERGGFPGLAELARRYRELGLRAGAACDYGATHAVLDAALPAPGALLYRDRSFQLVALPTAKAAGGGPAAGD